MLIVLLYNYFGWLVVAILLSEHGGIVFDDFCCHCTITVLEWRRKMWYRELFLLGRSSHQINKLTGIAKI
jgi:hypothetical protein